MCRQSKSIILAAVLSAFAGAVVASAQNSREVATVPFAFHTQGPVLASGQVSVKEVNDRGIYTLTDSEGTSTFWTASRKEVADPGKPHLTFACYGHDCVLAEISMPGSSTAFKASEASIDKQLQRKIGVAAMIRVPLH